MKRAIAVMMAALISTTSFSGIAGLASPTKIVYAANESAVSIVKNGDTIVIGNGYISREFSVENNKVKTTSIVNKRTDGGNTIFTPKNGSEEFVINMVSSASIPDPEYPAPLPKTTWTATANSWHNNSGPSDGPPSNLIDGNLNSIWHTNYGGGTGPTNYPFYVIFDLKTPTAFSAFSYTPRQGAATNGDIKAYELYVANTEAELETATPIIVSNFKYDAKKPIYVNLPEETTGRFVKLVAKSANNGQPFAGGAEFDLFSEKIPEKPDLTELTAIKSSKLTLKSVNEENITNGKKLTFTYEPYTHEGIEYSINEILVMYDGDHFMRKYLEISVPTDKTAEAKIDYIDLEALKVDNSDETWTHPEMGGGVGGMSGYVISLGQPVYIQGMFLGCEFPMTETEITEEENIAHMRYYSGKSFDRLKRDNQITTDGKYVTWQTVVGAARSTDMQVIQSDFYEYINSISTPTDFRIQYNSWYDNMMLINDANIESAFLGTEKGLTNSGVAPIDSYVVDDGWNNYNTSKYAVNDVARSGNTQNQTGFWEFNSKFPKGFQPSSELVDKLGSQFGVWLGPRGGYNYPSQLGRIIEDSGKGAYNPASWDIDIGDRTYLQNLLNFFIEQQEANKINYWKLDGFATAACSVATHNHVVGGKNGMYYFTDTWEGWIDVFEAMRDNAKLNDIQNYWLNITCYVNPSPWYLQWANTVWMQNSNDIGRINTGLTSEVDQLLSYRDDRYFDFVEEREFQFPLANMYNHDPIYGKEGGVPSADAMNDDEFRAYLYMMATRGTAFWELYYSPNFIDTGTKWEINADLLSWAKEKFYILRNAKLIGETPAGRNPYGYSCWDGTEGIVSLRNPSTTEKTLTFTLDRTIGVAEDASNLKRTTRMTFRTPAGADNQYKTVNYGDVISVTLKPGEARVWEFSEQADTKAPALEKAYSEAADTITIKYDEMISNANFKVDGNTILSVTKRGDLRTFDIKVAKPLANASVTNVSASEVRDMEGNTASNASIPVTYYKNNNIINISSSSDLKGDVEINEEGNIVAEGQYEVNTNNAVSGNHSFSVVAEIKTGSSNVNVASQEGAYSLSIGADGKAKFAVNGMEVISKEAVNTNEFVNIKAVKENNGMLKLYINNVLNGSAYNVDKANSILQAGVTTIGGNSFSGLIKGIRVINGGLSFDKAVSFEPIVKDNELEVAGNEATSAKVGYEANKANDGNENTYWQSDEAIDNRVNRQYFTVDLGKLCKVEEVVYKPGKDAQVGNILSYVLEASMDGKTWTAIKKGSFSTRNTSFTIALNAPITVKYLRISATDTSHTNPELKGSVVNVAELKIFGEEATSANLALNKPITGFWTADNTPVKVSGARPLTMAVDGVIPSDPNYNYVDFGDDNRKESSYVQVDLQKQSIINSIKMYRYWADGRRYAATVIAISETPNFESDKTTIVYNSDTTGEIHGLGAGTDSLYSESNQGKEITLATPVNGRYVRVYMYGRDDAVAPHNRTNHIVELLVNGIAIEEPLPELDLTELLAKIAEAEAVDTTGCSSTSIAALKAAIDEAKNVYITAKTQEVVDEMITKLDDAIKALLPEGQKGDVDENGVIGMNDVLITLKAIKNGTANNLPQSADVNNDGQVTKADAQSILDFIITGKW